MTPLAPGTVTLTGGNLADWAISWRIRWRDRLQPGCCLGQRRSHPQRGTTTSLDGAGNVLYDTTVFSPGGGLPANGFIVSQSNPAVAFQLRPYTASNVLLTTDTAGHTLTLTNPGSFQTLSILDLATNGTATFGVTLNFQDGTQDTTTFSAETAPDWFTGTGFAIGGLGRVSQTSPTYSGLPTNPDLFEQDSACRPRTRPRYSVPSTFMRQSGGTLGIFAVSGTQPQQSYPNNVVVTSNATIDVEMARLPWARCPSAARRSRSPRPAPRPV